MQGIRGMTVTGKAGSICSMGIAGKRKQFVQEMYLKRQ